MSGQYPPPNPSHPYSRLPPSQRPFPPWGHAPQPGGLNMVGSPMNFYNSPHMGIRGSQPWVPPQTHPKPTEANPLYGLQMLMSADNAARIPSEYQQEETMDLSSHSSVPKIASARSENTSDVLRNGTILPSEVNVNGEVDRTETTDEVKESVVTSVIAMNPLRECAGINDTSRPTVGVEEEAGTASEMIQGDTVIKPGVDICATTDNSPPENVTEPVNSFTSSVLKMSTSIKPVVEKEPVNDDGVEDSALEIKKSVEESLDVRENVSFENIHQVDDDTQKQDESGASFLESSLLSVDTDESKLVVAESSTDDIFGISPVSKATALVSEEDKKAKDPIESVPSEAVEAVSSESSVACLSALSNDQQPVVTSPVVAPTVDDSEPSVENVEILLENMFNSQEETSCSSQSSNSAVPLSVIVNGNKIPSDPSRPLLETPMKVEDLASTLSEDTPLESEIKEEKVVANEVMDEIEKKLEMLTEESVSHNVVQFDKKVGEENREQIKEEPDNCKGIDEGVVATLSNDIEKAVEEKLSKPNETELPALTTEPGTSSNPFIEVETQLEKMFAGIVESTDEVGSENQLFQPSVSELKRPVVNKRTVTKRKRANNRRPSDCSVFGGGSSGESTPVKKKGRKRTNDGGNERRVKKAKVDSSETFKKKKLPKDISNDNFSGKVKGPFVHIEGLRESPSSVVVVNSGVRLDDEDALDKGSARRKHSTIHRTEGLSSRKVYSSSTLSARYNSDTADLSWVCVFCHRGPHCEGGLGGVPAGDLFGPYRVPVTPPNDDTLPPGTPADRDVADEQKRRGGKFPKSLRTSGGSESFVQKVAKKSKRSMSADSIEGPGLLQVEDSYEVWIHGACAEWAPGICVVGSTLVGLGDAVWTTARTRCSYCGESGAGISCVTRSCPARVHYPCALLSDWLLDPETFIARCHMHRTRLRPS